MSTVQELVEQLELAEASEEPSIALRSTLSRIRNDVLLWEVADASVPLLAIRVAIYERALQLGASEETARGYLALAYIFEGDTTRAQELVKLSANESGDAVLLSAWSALGEEPSEIVMRLKAGLQRCPGAIRLWRQLATEALRAGFADLARDSHRWLLAHESNPRERARVQEIIDERGW